jgi:ribonuclease Z
LSRIAPRPRLTVPTHFPVSDDTVACALESVRAKVPDIGRLGEQISWSFDLMVLRVFADRILQHRAVVDDWSLVQNSASIPAADQDDPKYWAYEIDAQGNPTGRKTADPTGQLDLTAWIPPGPDTYDESGY